MGKRIDKNKSPFTRKATRPVKVGEMYIGSGHPVLVQSMTSTDTRDIAATLAQIGRLAEAGCELVRVAVPDSKAVAAFEKIVAASSLPVVADIHFDYRLALAAVDAGAAKLRINPGNIGSPERVRRIAEAAVKRKIPIRIGVNSGSVEKHLLERHGGPVPEALVESALNHCSLLEDAGFEDIVVSLKASDVLTTVAANRLFATRKDYPLHLGVTEAGMRGRGTVVSSVGLGIMLSDGLGDTVRVSLTADPVEEVAVAWRILAALKIRRRGVEIISCPTCGRTEVDLIGLAEEVERRLSTLNLPLTVAVMGCVVNGPGEAKEADFGIAAGRGGGVIFRKGEKVCKVSESRLVERLVGIISEETGTEIP
ncbi:MAG: flavodoxin-dependent (E)-4-hydroxy-3-methylbut-2-enyl-diphosphate synthase [Gemmatimonadota bacterium]|nr:flavodoxin-dependent (E)-4-hydroxy-3-methylbut-2-enyl-diphosphate synthase [Gemmatimonadota bacterium]